MASDTQNIPRSPGGLMRAIDIPPAFGHTIFCDDIRNEVGGKLSYMGVYNHFLYVHQDFPTSISKLCFSVFLTQQREFFEPDVAIRLFFPEIEGDRLAPDTKPSAEARLSPDEVEANLAYNLSNAPQDLKEQPDRVIRMNLNIVVAPLLFQKEGLISVRAFRKNDIVRLGQLKVLRAPKIENQAASKQL